MVLIGKRIAARAGGFLNVGFDKRRASLHAVHECPFLFDNLVEKAVNRWTGRRLRPCCYRGCQPTGAKHMGSFHDELLVSELENNVDHSRGVDGRAPAHRGPKADALRGIHSLFIQAVPEPPQDA